MTGLALTAVAGLLIVAGCGFFLAGTIGLLRLPDFYCRLHATTKCDPIGAVLILTGAALLSGPEISTIRILALIALIVITSPTAGHALARAGWHAGHVPWTREPGNEPE
ncbi:monovalent cation/H(+) antiporter subunit G [Wenzhouxiangella limi]|uniref:monovalent cation/H(+) antiporter subunit G n=1 Tax=Wenzhouxiangella limi TaxID=2707351 RepID=UPI00194269CC